MRTTPNNLRIPGRVLMTSLLTIVIGVPAAAQREGTATGTRAGWLPRTASMGGNLTAAQKAAAFARLEEIERILLQVPELANPDGFEVQPDFYGGARRLGPGQREQPDNVVEYMFRLWFFHPTQAIAHEGCTCITIRMNWVSNIGGGEYFDEQGRAIYIEAPRGDPMPLATQVYYGLSPTEAGHVDALFTAGGQIPWKTVTRAEFYNAVIFETEGKDGAKQADYRASLTRTPYQQWLEGAAERRQQREETLRGLAATLPAEEVTRMRKTLEDNEREVGERLKADEAVHRENNAEALAASYSLTGRMRAELDSMPAALRNMPAVIHAGPEGPAATGWHMADSDSPNAWRVLTPDHDFWRTRRSPDEVHGIHVQISAGTTGLIPVVHNALWQAFRKLDWAAIHRLLDVPR